MRSGMSSGIVARPLAGYIGAQIEGIDLSCPMDEPTFSSVRTALATYGVIFFREQRLTPDQHEVFTGHFGSPTDVRFVTMVEGHAHISEVPKDLPVRFVSFSVDPKHDTPEVLRAYGEKYDQDPARWTFLTGELGAVMKAVEEGFRIGVTGADDPDATPFDIVHGEHFVLIDRKGTIRGYYPNADPSLKRLVEDAKRLAKEG